MTEILEGNVIGNYRVVRALGQGGMGAVYEVEHTKLGVHYAMMNSIRLALGPDLVSEWLNKHRNDKTAKSVEILNHVDRQRVKAKQRIEKDREVYSDAEHAVL